jgi:hypothetical protein
MTIRSSPATVWRARAAPASCAPERDAREAPVGNAWVLWLSVQVVRGLLLVAVVGGVVVLRIGRS